MSCCHLAVWLQTQDSPVYLESVECAPAAATLMGDFVYSDFMNCRKAEVTWCRWRLVLVKAIRHTRRVELHQARDSVVSERRRWRALAQTHCALRSAGSVVALGALWPVIDAIHSWMMVARYSVFWASCHMIVSTRRLRRLINGDSLRVVAAADSKEKAAAYLRLLLRIRKRYLEERAGSELLSVGP